MTNVIDSRGNVVDVHRKKRTDSEWLESGARTLVEDYEKNDGKAARHRLRIDSMFCCWKGDLGETVRRILDGERRAL